MGLQNETSKGDIDGALTGEFISFGKHRGTRWTRVPVGYLTWLANNPEPSYAKARAAAELARRGTTYPTVQITGHAIDRASTYCYDIYKSTRKGKEGLNSWLIRMSEEAQLYGEAIDKKIRYKGMIFVLEVGEFYPVLKTIIRSS